MKKIKNKKKLFGTFKWTSNESEKNFFLCDNSKSKIIARVHCTFASKDKMIRIWPKFKLFFNFSPQVPYL
jgi:hypothetical protein